MSLQSDLLKKYGERIADDFRKSVPHVTGKTANSIVCLTDDNSIEIWANDYIYALEFGRKPTENGHEQGTPYLVDAIKEWAIAKGIVPDDSKQSMGIIWAITNKIHREGTELFREHKPSGVLSGVIQRMDLNSLLDAVGVIQMNAVDDGVLKEMQRLVGESPNRFNQ